MTLDEQPGASLHLFRHSPLPFISLIQLSFFFFLSPCTFCHIGTAVALLSTASASSVNGQVLKIQQFLVDTSCSIEAHFESNGSAERLNCTFSDGQTLSLTCTHRVKCLGYKDSCDHLKIFTAFE